MVELRGYTFHKDRSQFLIDTLVNNLATRRKKEESGSGAKPSSKEATSKQPEKVEPKTAAAAKRMQRRMPPRNPSRNRLRSRKSMPRN